MRVVRTMNKIHLRYWGETRRRTDDVFDSPEYEDEVSYEEYLEGLENSNMSAQGEGEEE